MEFKNPPLLLRAVRAGAHGQRVQFTDTLVFDAGFIYLDGTPDADARTALYSRWGNRMFIPLTQAWEQELEQWNPLLVHTRRFQMQAGPADEAALAAYTARLPAGYALREFDAEAFSRHPFGHGLQFPDYAAFARDAAGTVVWKEGEIVASASSFITFSKETELDVFTLVPHRRHGLALACCAQMLLQCTRRGITMHWDAQNGASRALAEKLGFELETAYMAYSFFAPEIP